MASLRLVALREIGSRLEEKRYQPKGVAAYDFGLRVGVATGLRPVAAAIASKLRDAEGNPRCPG
ncbi:MAG: hypothetical protein NTAFB05_18760 [Nitrobacter sp.]